MRAEPKNTKPHEQKRSDTKTKTGAGNTRHEKKRAYQKREERNITDNKIIYTKKKARQ